MLLLYSFWCTQVLTLFAMLILQNFRVLDTGLDITPPGDKTGTHFALHNLKNVLPNIIVNVIPR